MNRRNFLKFVTSLCAASAIPPALVEACQSSAPVPADWVVRILDPGGEVVSEMLVESIGDQISFPTMTRSVCITHFSVSGLGLPHEIISPIAQILTVCSGDTVHLCDVKIEIT